MNFSWMFGPTMEAHHLLCAYITVWVVQGGYCLWVAWKWMQTKSEIWPTPANPPLTPDSSTKSAETAE